MLSIYCVVLFVVIQGPVVEGRMTKGCGNPGKPRRGYRVGNDFSAGATVEFFCDSGQRMVSGSRLRTCNKDGKWSGTLPRCRDINECVEYDPEPRQTRARSFDVQRHASAMCHPHATCINSIGSFQCKCNAGYHGDGRECYHKDLFGMREFLMKSKNRLSRSPCGTVVSRNTSRIRRIVGGDISSRGAWPWQAAIYYRNGGKTFLFNGALIKPGWVLTIANVLRKGGRAIKPRKLRVVLGELDTAKMENNEVSMKVKRIIVHPGYSRNNFSNNIALLQLSRPIRLNNFIRTVCIPRKKKDTRLERPHNYGTVAGWGTTRKISLGENPGRYSAKLRQVTVPIVPDRECQRASIYSFDSSLNFCAGFKRIPKDPCMGDIGSPLVMQNPRTGRWVVVGLFGWSEGCGQPRKYSYYTRVSKYRHWIISVIRNRH